MQNWTKTSKFKRDKYWGKFGLKSGIYDLRSSRGLTIVGVLSGDIILCINKRHRKRASLAGSTFPWCNADGGDMMYLLKVLRQLELGATAMLMLTPPERLYGGLWWISCLHRRSRTRGKRCCLSGFRITSSALSFVSSDGRTGGSTECGEVVY